MKSSKGKIQSSKLVIKESLKAAPHQYDAGQAARWIHALWWFREAHGREGKRIMVREWNALYPSAPIKLMEMYRKQKAESSRQ